MYACSGTVNKLQALPSVCDCTHQCLRCMIHTALAIQSGFGIYNEAGMNQCKSADRLVNTVPVTGASPMRKSNTVVSSFLECIDNQGSQGCAWNPRELKSE